MLCRPLLHLAVTGCRSSRRTTHQSYTRAVGSAGSSPREPALLPRASKVGQGTRHSPLNSCQGRRASGSCKIDLGKNIVQHAEPGSGAATLATCPRPLRPRSRGRGNSSLGLPNPSSHGSDYRLSHPRREKAPPGVGRTPSHPADHRVRAGRGSAVGNGPRAIPAVAAPWARLGAGGVSPLCFRGTPAGLLCRARGECCPLGQRREEEHGLPETRFCLEHAGCALHATALT